MFSRVHSCANLGLDSFLVEVEADRASHQQTNFIVVGLPDAAVQEARERVRQAIYNTGLEFPRGKIIVNLAPADLRKEGPGFDLPMAVSILLSTGQLTPENVAGCLFIGQLTLNGETRSTAGILPATIFAKEKNYRKIFLPAVNAEEASLVKDIDIYPITDLKQLVAVLTEKISLTPYSTEKELTPVPEISEYDMANVAGQEQAKRALEIAAAGMHNALMSGPPGSGKTLLAKSLPGILPGLSQDEIIEVTKIYSIAGRLTKEEPIIRQRPFRSPHHTSSGAALVGGGNYPKPGEISLAHRGVLFLDEFPEFSRAVLENLRQPLEDGQIVISRAQGSLSFPARFILIASQNPCPCGYLSDPEKNCTCSPTQISKYRQKLSGPILDRIDLHIEVPRLDYEKIQGQEIRETSATIKERVAVAQAIQRARFSTRPFNYNAEMRPEDIKNHCHPDAAGAELMKNAVNRLKLSARSFHRLLKIARTIADLAGRENIRDTDIAEALQFRPQDNH